MIEFDSASAIAGGSATGSHLLHIEGYSHIQFLTEDKPIDSQPFDVGGRTWRIRCHPGGIHTLDFHQVVFFILLDDSIPEPAFAQVNLFLLDRAGNEMPASQIPFMRKYSFAGDGFGTFFMRQIVESPECLVNDSFRIRVEISVSTRVRTETRRTMSAAAAVAVPAAPLDLQRHLGDLFVAGEGADVTFLVAGETFRAHRCILAARSPVFKAELFEAMRQKSNDAAAEVCVRVYDVEPQVFNALLHFVYTDSLPPSEIMTDEPDVVTVQRLLEAADRYDMPRLKLVCEEKMCGCLLDTRTAATTLVLAHQHRCNRLKNACMEFLRCPQVLQAVMATDGFELIITSYPTLLKELISQVITAP
ncbi:hypothetical protein PR202_gb08367 [Eleusine coracana subsp. coracana]|uniref:Uncharacterized protein n=1 Tax=Eleusine coracana subsp. coracana TaxID=191504 RepID=A0AAV5EEG9_ELECO|nr:hypothetical protein QOZ80_2BG0184380 [Eleusine coracana subsp. coracana]GJN20929.1 hypothetical protein PR202_gb08367 [Eleusine coracana subsp. coracana]